MTIKMDTKTMSMGGTLFGGRDGRNVGKDSYEGARLYYRLKKVFGTDTVNEKSLDEEKATQYKLYKKVAAQLENQAKEASMYVMILNRYCCENSCC